MKLSDLAKRMIFTIVIIAMISIIGSVIYHRSLEFLPFMLGVILGSTASVIKIFLLEHAVDQALKMEQGKAGNYVTIQHILRLLLSGGALLLGALIPQIS